MNGPTALQMLEPSSATTANPSDMLPHNAAAKQPVPDAAVNTASGKATNLKIKPAAPIVSKTTQHRTEDVKSKRKT